VRTVIVQYGYSVIFDNWQASHPTGLPNLNGHILGALDFLP